MGKMGDGWELGMGPLGFGIEKKGVGHSQTAPTSF
jgi:hypothetical protein